MLVFHVTVSRQNVFTSMHNVHIFRKRGSIILKLSRASCSWSFWNSWPTISFFLFLFREIFYLFTGKWISYSRIVWVNVYVKYTSMKMFSNNFGTCACLLQLQSLYTTAVPLTFLTCRPLGGPRTNYWEPLLNITYTTS